MSQRPKKRRPGGQPKPASVRKRNNLTFRVRDDLRERLARAAQDNERSISEEIELRLNRDFGWEQAKGDIEQMRAKAAAALSAARVQALRAAGLLILRDIDGRPRRVVVDLESLLAEADGLLHGWRSGFVGDEA